jgi:hypothetical protein
MERLRTEDRLTRNLRTTLALAFFQVFLVIMPVAVPFFQSKGLSMQEVFSLQALFALAVLVTEVPSGYVADLIGSRHRQQPAGDCRRVLGAGSVRACPGHQSQPDFGGRYCHSL